MKVRTAALVIFGAALVAAIVGYQLGLRDGKRVSSNTNSKAFAEQTQRLATSESTNALVSYDSPRRRSLNRSVVGGNERLGRPLMLNLSPAAMSNLDVVPAHRRHFDDQGVMNEYRMRWEQQLRSSDSVREPVFNPSSVERVLER